MEDVEVLDVQIADKLKRLEEQANLWKQQNPERWKEFQQILEESKGMVEL